MVRQKAFQMCLYDKYETLYEDPKSEMSKVDLPSLSYVKIKLKFHVTDLPDQGINLAALTTNRKRSVIPTVVHVRTLRTA